MSELQKDRLSLNGEGVASFDFPLYTGRVDSGFSSHHIVRMGGLGVGAGDVVLPHLPFGCAAHLEAQIWGTFSWRCAGMQAERP